MPSTKICRTCNGHGVVCYRCSLNPQDCTCDWQADEFGGYAYPPARIECPHCGGWGSIESVD